MRIQAAIRGNLSEIMRDELDAATGGVQRGIRRAASLAKGQLRQQVRRAGLGERLAKTWQDKDRRGRPLFYRNEGLNPAAIVRSGAPQIIAAHMKGAVIRSKRGKFLAIPTEHAFRVVGASRRRRISPSNWPKGKGELRYVHRKNGPDLLVLAEARLTKTGRVSANTRTKKGRLRSGSATLVMFILVRQVKLKKRLPGLDGVANRIGGMLPSIILREYQKEQAA